MSLGYPDHRNSTDIIDSYVKTEDELKAGVPTLADDNDPIYVGWDEGIWEFGINEEYPYFN